MRRFTFFNDIDATTNQTSEIFTVDCGQDMRFLLEISKTGTDGNPKIILEQRIDDGGLWLPIDNEDNYSAEFILTTSPMSIRDSYFMGESMRIRLESNGNTTGTVKIRMGFKTKV